MEISKRDIWDPRRVAQERPDLGYSLLAVDFLTPAAVHASLKRMAAGLMSGRLTPLPQVWHASVVCWMVPLEDALQAMQRNAVSRLVLMRAFC